MHLKSITLKGFKSFAQPTTLEFQPGITCVVGPNGSGKSNVVDALAWVMGEQGAKTLRGGKMEDVIFAGTATKGPLGRAEVQLTIDNADGALPIEYSEVTISRVLFRNGASEYAINGEPCRLLDVQELLSDSGLGREMHVIVGQGQLDTVLRATPFERRAFIEEAAGILKYRRRKEKTERKLEAMQVNLTRLADLAAELRRNLKPLGRQAEVAKQAKEIGAIAREAKAKLLAIQISQIKQQLEQSSKSEAERRAESSFVQQQLQSARVGIQELESGLVSDELDALRKQVFAFESAETKLRSLQSIAQQRVTLLGQQEFSSREIEAAELEAQLGEAEKELSGLESAIESAADSLREKEATRTAAVDNLAAFEAQNLRMRAEAEQIERQRSQAENQLSVLASKIDGFEAQELALKQQQAEALERVAELQKEQESIQPGDEGTSDEKLRKAYEEARAIESKAKVALEELRDKLHASERERDAVAAKHAALGMTLEQADGTSDVRSAKLAGIKGMLADTVSVNTGYEVAIAVALGSLADAVVAQSRQQAIAAIRYLKAQDMGRADFLIDDGETIPAQPIEVEGLIEAASLVSAPKAVKNALANVYVAKDLDSALAAIESKRFENSRVITEQGDVVSQFLVTGGGSKQPSSLELAAERDAAAKQLVNLAKTIETESAELQSGREALAKAEAGVRNALSELQQHDAELAARAERIGRVVAQVDAARAEAQRAERELEVLASNKNQAISDHALAQVRLDEIPETQTVEANQVQRDALVDELEKARQAELEIRIEVGALGERRSGSSKSVAILRGRLNEVKAGLEREKEALERRSKQLENTNRALAIIPGALASATQTGLAVRAQLREKEAERIKQTERLNQLRQQATGLEAKFAELNQGVHNVELQNHELRLTLSNLSERVKSELNIDQETLLSETEIGEQTKDEIEAELRKAERQLSQLGAFNPLALEEFAALEERHKYLSSQLEDLTKARADLVGIIKDLDEKMQSIFSAAFEDTKREFEKVFPILFPGGTGSISLTEPEDLLATGIEVAVRPVGKRIERMSLLSGGERSLAAVALLIAIFKARPSPFYVLDEVEAALDDANLGRLLEVVESLRKSSQLIIVTHQKRTMEIADALYGVSMRQDGMSAVVGQKLEGKNV